MADSRAAQVTRAVDDLNTAAGRCIILFSQDTQHEVAKLVARINDVGAYLSPERMREASVQLTAVVLAVRRDLRIDIATDEHAAAVET